MMREEALHTTLFGSPLIWSAVRRWALFSAAYSFRFIAHTFLARSGTDLSGQGPTRKIFFFFPGKKKFFPGLWISPALMDHSP